MPQPLTLPASPASPPSAQSTHRHCLTMDVLNFTGSTRRIQLLFYPLLFTLIECIAILKGAQEYCQWETFNATCRPDEAVVMETARFGRMMAGRCVSREYGHLGCYDDTRALLYVDSKCSGRKTCSFPVTQFVQDGFRPCPKDVAPYLEASHKCVKVTSDDSHRRECLNDKEIKLTSSKGFISSSVSDITGHGTSSCPWVIEVKAGQRINVTLLDFGLWQRQLGDSGSSSLYCHKYAMIQEGEQLQQTTICGSRERERVVYLSKGNKLKITVSRSTADEDASQFILRYEAVGCYKNFAAPAGSVVRYSEDVQTVTVSCNNTGVTWHLRCVGTAWSGGKVGNCTQGDAKSTWNSIFGSSWSSSHGIVIVVVLGIGLGVLIGLCMLGVAILILRKRGWTFGWGAKEAAYVPESTMSPPYESKYATSASTKGYSGSGYSSEALLVSDNIIIDPRATSNYGDLRGTWSAGVHAGQPMSNTLNNNPRIHRASLSSLGHIYESPDFVTRQDSINGSTS